MIRKLWAIQFRDSSNGERLFPLFDSWHGYRKIFYKGEPTRALLFETRATARRWCQEKTLKYIDRQDCCKFWRFRPIRVTESLKVPR